ncbi:unnamed protein product, partial [Rotaria sp. Silwood1]
KFIIFEKSLMPLESIKIFQAEQLISIMEYLYKSRIIHRDIRPQNVMHDIHHNHLKLIDFGFATALKNDENTKELEVEGVISYGGLKFLKLYLEGLEKKTFFTYQYERTFDLQCSLNVIMYFKDSTIATKVKSFKHLSLQERATTSYEFWLELKQNDKNYNDLLNLIENVSNLSDFQTIKQRIKVLFE